MTRRVALACMVLNGCWRFAPADTAAPPPAPPALRAVLGEGGAVVWTDRDLEAGERVERVDAFGTAVTVGLTGRVWLDPTPAATYRWVGPEEQVEAAPGTLECALPELGLAQRDETIARAFTWGGADLTALPLALEVVRDAAGWLDASCESGAPCWRDGEVWWDRWDEGGAPAEIVLSWSAEEPEPAARSVEVRFLAQRDGAGDGLCAAATLDLQTGRRLLWGDLHAHTNLSYDGCEDMEHLCAPRGDLPASDAFAFAEDAGLDFVALTDHAEYETWTRDDLGLTADIWEETLRLAREQDGGAVIPIVGFEWTGVYEGIDPGTGALTRAGGHRTVIFDVLDPCEDHWIGGSVPEARKEGWGVEHYAPRAAYQGQPDAFLAALDEAAAACGGAARHLSWFHHTAMELPRQVHWGVEVNRGLGDRVVEVYSEHGSSECRDEEQEGCDWQLSDHHAGGGAVQAALQRGYALGFLAGTDSHDGRPGSYADGPGAIVGSSDGEGGYYVQLAPGGVTGALVSEADRGGIFDAIAARRTLAASWRFATAFVVGLGQDGTLYLPGDDVPAAASPLRLLVRLDDMAVEGWRVQVLDDDGVVWLDVEDASVDEPLDLAPGDVRYVRVRATQQETEQRLWASPFFGVE